MWTPLYNTAYSSTSRLLPLTSVSSTQSPVNPQCFIHRPYPSLVGGWALSSVHAANRVFMQYRVPTSRFVLLYTVASTTHEIRHDVVVVRRQIKRLCFSPINSHTQWRRWLWVSPAAQKVSSSVVVSFSESRTAPRYVVGNRVSHVDTILVRAVGSKFVHRTCTYPTYAPGRGCVRPDPLLQRRPLQLLHGKKWLTETRVKMNKMSSAETADDLQQM